MLEEDSEVDLHADKITDRARLHGDVEYENLHFTYETRPDVEVLKGVSLKIKAGEKVALAGASGSGKSTIAQLLMRFYDLNGGRLLVDGQPLESYPIAWYRSHIGIVPQEVILFGGTIRENIGYGKLDATDEEIRAAARKANALEFIEEFPEGFDTIVGERGIKLSGGQRQRLAIARAILKDPEILILDEATSSLDAASEKAVQDALDTLMEGRTTLIIAHRLATIRDVDRIYVIDDGQIMESGSHDELIANPDGQYHKLVQLQMKSV
ncbi:MAG: ABC subfamily B transporter ATP-binding protein [Bacteroidota bacterium]